MDKIHEVEQLKRRQALRQIFEAITLRSGKSYEGQRMEEKSNENGQSQPQPEEEPQLDEESEKSLSKEEQSKRKNKKE